MPMWDPSTGCSGNISWEKCIDYNILFIIIYLLYYYILERTRKRYVRGVLSKQTRHIYPNVWPMLANHLRRLPNIGETVGRCVVFAGIMLDLNGENKSTYQWWELVTWMTPSPPAIPSHRQGASLFSSPSSSPSVYIINIRFYICIVSVKYCLK